MNTNLVAVYSSKDGLTLAQKIPGRVGWRQKDDTRGSWEELIFVQPPGEPEGTEQWIPIEAYRLKKDAIRKGNIEYYEAYPELVARKIREKKGNIKLHGRVVVSLAGTHS